MTGLPEDEAWPSYADGGVVGGDDAFSEGGRVGAATRLVEGAIRAFHGSPHRFDRFSTEHIGRGEGAQAYGHGLYFAGDEDVARHYRNRLAMADGQSLLIDGVPFREFQGDTRGSNERALAIRKLEELGYRAGRHNPGPGFEADLRSRLEQEARNTVDVVERDIRNWHRAPEGSLARGWSLEELQAELVRARGVQEVLRDFAGRRFEWQQPGAMYEVNLHVPAERLLDWDASLLHQPEPVQEAFRRFGVDRPHYVKPDAPPHAVQGIIDHMGFSGGDAWKSLAHRMGQDPEAAAQALLEEGVPGVRYLDGNSRRAGTGHHNYVTFSDEPVEILRRYRQGGMVAGFGEEAAFAEGGRVGAAARMVEQAIRAYHGTPHAFDRFDISKIGSGEGHQAYGHGLYFAENEEVARFYRDALRPREWPEGSPERAMVDLRENTRLRARAEWERAIEARERVHFGAIGDAIGRGLTTLDPEWGLLATHVPREVWRDHRDALSAANALVRTHRNAMRAAWDLPDPGPPPSHMYEVNLHVDPERLLHWDRPLADQHRVVQDAAWEAMREAGVSGRVADYVVNEKSGRHAYDAAARGQYDPLHMLDQENAPEASRRLLERGVPGLRYLDGGSRSAGDGSHNYVIFDDRPVEIVRRYNQGGTVAGFGEETAFSEGGRVGGLRRLLDAGLDAYHGSPHVFDRFQRRHMGSGEGAQAFGRGHYFTESEALAEHYRQNLLRRQGRDPDAPFRLEWTTPEGQAALRALPEDAQRSIAHPWQELEQLEAMLDEYEFIGTDGLTRRNYHRPEVIREAEGLAEGGVDMGTSFWGSELEQMIDMARKGEGGYRAQDVPGYEAALAALGRLPELPYRVVPNLGATYEVRLNADPGQLLSLDQPLRWQSGEVRRRIAGFNWGPNMERALEREWDAMSDPRMRIKNLQAQWETDNRLVENHDWYGRIPTDGLSPRAREFWRDFDPAREADRYDGRSTPPFHTALDDISYFANNGGPGDQMELGPDELAAWSELRDHLGRHRGAAQARPRHVEDALSEAGIPGLRYLDGNSRRGGSGSHNFVVFEDDPVEVRRRYAEGGLVDYRGGNPTDALREDMKRLEDGLAAGLGPWRGYQVPYTDEERAAMVLPAGVGQRRPVRMGGEDQRGGTAEGPAAADRVVRGMGEVLWDLAVPQNLTDAGLMVATAPLGGPVGAAFSRAVPVAGRAVMAGLMMAADGSGSEAEGGPLSRARQALRAYHGSPHRFDRFDVSKIGTGEGAQAYGHGLYFAGSEDVARHYRDALSPIRARPLPQTIDEVHQQGQFRSLLAEEAALLRTVGAYEDALKQGAPAHVIEPLLAESRAGLAALEPRLGSARAWQAELEERARGHLYEVNLHVEPDSLLDWNRPLIEQPEGARHLFGVKGDHADMLGEYQRLDAEHAALLQRWSAEGQFDGPNSEALRAQMLELRERQMGPSHGLHTRAFTAYEDLAERLGSPAEASAALLDHGVPGIRYLDGNSRRAGDGSSNYVMFDDKPVEILRRYENGGVVE